MIELRSVTKSYLTPHGRRFVFRDLNFAFPEGVNIALIGRNGAGKSTLMRLIGGIDMPDRGEVVTDKNISWPVGLSGGFQGKLSGRDNVKFVCRVYGRDADEMREKIRFVEDFAELGEYFDLPLQSYSSGMRSRLAFGLSMAFDFDYYLIDECMAVGDAQFKEKSRAVFRDKIGKANIILVSHNMRDIRELCDLVVLVQEGEAILYPDLEAGVRAYQGSAKEDSAVRGSGDEARRTSPGPRELGEGVDMPLGQRVRRERSNTLSTPGEEPVMKRRFAGDLPLQRANAERRLRKRERRLARESVERGGALREDKVESHAAAECEQSQTQQEDRRPEHSRAS